MNTTYEIPLAVNDQYPSEYMNKLISNLENLEIIKCNVFNRLNQALSERVGKLENLKGRINRAITIISTYESAPSQAMTVKSKLIYPLDDQTFTRSVHFDPNANVSQAKQAMPIINGNKKNEETVLGKCPKGRIQDAELTQLTHNFFSTYRDVNAVIEQIHKNPSRINDDSVNPILECYNSAFNIFDKSLIVGKKTQASVDATEYSNLAGFLQTSEQKQKKKVIQDAPESIMNKEKLTQFDKKKGVHLTSQVEVKINLPNMMNLGNIADFGIEKELFEQTVVENTEAVDFDDDDMKYDQRMSSVDEDINTPMDLIKNRKGVNPPIKAVPTQTVQPTTYTVSMSAQPSVPSQSSSVPQVPVVSNTGPGVPIPPLMNFSVPQVPVVSNSGPGVPMPPPMNFPATAKEPVPPKAPAIPSVPSVPAVPGIPSVPTVVAGSGPGIPLPPPMPMINLTIPKVPSEPIEKKETTKKPAEPRPLTMQEEIGANPMARLKKIGDVKVAEKVETKKQATTTDMMSLLKQQIGLRFQNLHKHEDLNKSDSDSNSDSD